LHNSLQFEEEAQLRELRGSKANQNGQWWQLLRYPKE
jgi:L-amino acid N-acyltransferase YncA